MSTATDMMRQRARSLLERYGTEHDHANYWSADCLACAFRAGREWQLLTESMAEGGNGKHT